MRILILALSLSGWTVIASSVFAQIDDEVKKATLSQGNKLFAGLQVGMKENLIKSEYVLKNRRIFEEGKVLDAIRINRCCKLQLAMGWMPPIIDKNNKEVGKAGVLGVIRADVLDENQFRGTECIWNTFTVIRVVDDKSAVVRYGDPPWLQLENIDSTKMAAGGEYTCQKLF